MWKQKIFITIAGLALIFLLAAAGPARRAQIVSAKAWPTSSKVFVNGKQIEFEAYEIGDFNFFKLRDLAYVLNGTEKQVEVVWDGAKSAISIISGRPYTVSGGEILPGDKLDKRATTTDAVIYFNDVQTDLNPFNIDGNNYFKLRELMEIFNVYVGWDEATGSIALDTSKAYADVSKAQTEAEFEKEVFRLVNVERGKYGLSPFAWDDTGAAVARAHSADMATRGYFDHFTPEGVDPFTRMRNGGVSIRGGAAENIAHGHKTPAGAVNGWMNSPGHRANILSEDFTYIGVGVSGDYWTQVFWR